MFGGAAGREPRQKKIFVFSLLQKVIHSLCTPGTAGRGQVAVKENIKKNFAPATLFHIPGKRD